MSTRRNERATLGASCVLARTLLALGAIAASVLLASCAPAKDRGVPVRIELSGDPIGVRHGVPVRIVVIDPASLGGGESAEVTVTLLGDSDLLGQHVAVFYEDDRHLLMGIPTSASTAENHWVPGGAPSVKFGIKVTETTESGTVRICAQAYGTTKTVCADVYVNKALHTP